MRLIDADEVLVKIGYEMENSVADGAPQLYSEGLKSARIIVDTCETVSNNNVWISVKEKLPEKSGSVFVYCKGGYVGCVHYSKKNQKFNAFDEQVTFENAFDDVTHWMKLPEKPKEENDVG